MAYECEIVADSISERGHRLTTMVVTLPRIMLAELNTHRMFSRNSASSRAIPTRTQLRDIAKDTFVPREFGTAQGAMNAGKALEGEQLEQAIAIWGNAADSQMWFAMCLATSAEYVEREWEKWVLEENDDFGDFVLDVVDRLEDKEHPIHQEPLLKVTKGLTNRLLETVAWHKVIITATDWENFFNLRTDSNAQEEIRIAADMMKAAYEASTPAKVKEGEWHLPYIQKHEQEWAKANPELAMMASAARCARVSYLTHDKKALDLEADFRLAKRLSSNGHMSPFEHPAYPMGKAEWELRQDGVEAVFNSLNAQSVPNHVINQIAKSLEYSANFIGWGQARRDIPGEAVFRPSLAEAA